MMRRALLIAVPLSLLVAGALCLGGKDREMVLEPVARMSSEGNQAILIEFGQEADQAQDYPASFSARFLGECSATLVGRDAVLTSAHCVKLATNVELRINGRVIPAQCSPHKDYIPGDHATDVALCRLDLRDGSIPDVEFEVVSTAAAVVQPAVNLRLTGWADPPPASAIGRFWHRLKRCLGIGSAFKVGAAVVRQAGGTIEVEGAQVGEGHVVVEMGDSGGAAYVGKDPYRAIVGVNVCGGEYCSGDRRRSVLTNLSNERTAAFVKAWADTAGAQVCGVSDDSRGCRSATAPRQTGGGNGAAEPAHIGLHRISGDRVVH